MTLAGLVLDREDDAGLLAACKDGWALYPLIPKEAPGAPARPEGGGGAVDRPPPAGAPPTAQGSASTRPGPAPTGPAIPGTG